MIKKLLLTTSLAVVSFNSIGSTSFDVPLAKKCYALLSELTTIAAEQTTELCKLKIANAMQNTEQAALYIAVDDHYNSRTYLDDAIKYVRHAQIYSCALEEKIAAVDFKLSEIKSQIKRAI